jgi:hypothetical protein
MPTISQFFGIAIRMYFDEHAPPHFHAYYGGESAAVSIETLGVTEGHLPRRALALVLEWAVEHRLDLEANWACLEEHKPLKDIEPLV